MSAPITYSLDSAASHPLASYFDVVRDFSQLALAEAEVRVGPWVDRMMALPPESVQGTRTEYLLDLLVLGVLWRAHGGAASRLPAWLGEALAVIAAGRRRGPRAKRFIDLFRGMINTLLLVDRPNDRARRLPVDEFGLRRLLAWLGATAEYRRERERLVPWQRLLEAGDASHVPALLSDAIGLGVWFEALSEQRLGRYTLRVEAFLRTQVPHHKWDEDIVSVAKPRAEYHLAMVGAEVMNQAFRSEFVARKRRVLLLPGCMRARQINCAAEVTPRGHRCTGCVPSCRVHQMTRKGRAEGYEVAMLHHASDLSVWAPRKGEVPAGIVGVACMAPLLAGGWDLRALGLAAQCVPLDGCGCRAHWHPKGRRTSVNLDELERIMGAAGRNTAHTPTGAGSTSSLRPTGT